MLYRLFTENKNYDQIKKLVCNYFKGFTIIKAEGVWQGESKHSLIIEIIDDGVLLDYEQQIGKLVFDIKRLNQLDKIRV
ncbi:unnamed protein product [marine sediment metagenome]|uniref:Uncharacterized protein n=1 Tax=marine sediment metagenome TaxID=412755 RepID=X1GTL4_9ZZZZ